MNAHAAQSEQERAHRWSLTETVALERYLTLRASGHSPKRCHTMTTWAVQAATGTTEGAWDIVTRVQDYAEEHYLPAHKGMGR